MRRLWFLLMLAAPVQAQDGLLSYSLKPAVQQGQGLPQVLLHAQSDFKKVDLVCERDGATVTRSAAATKKGQTRSFDLDQPPGSFSWSCDAKGWYGSGADEFFDLSFRFQSFLGGPLKVEVPRETIDLPGQLLVARADREVRSAHIKVQTPDGVVFDEDVDPGENEAGQDLYLSWTRSGSPILRLDVTLTDRWGFFAYENIFPWSLEIPHDDVLFDTGSHAISAGEQPKVAAAYEEIRKVVERYGGIVEVRLYVGGYTDTVGDAASNQGLSERRARSIAEAFRKLGFQGPVQYQGFGEEALAVPTGDGVDEAGNRRAVYLLASRPPPPGPNFPRGHWKGL